MELQGDEAELRGEVAGGARRGDKGSLDAVGVVFGVSVGIVDVAGGWLRGNEGGERGRPGALGIASGAENDVLRGRAIAPGQPAPRAVGDPRSADFARNDGQRE